jgi:hypothetical protein
MQLALLVQGQYSYIAYSSEEASILSFRFWLRTSLERQIHKRTEPKSYLFFWIGATFTSQQYPRPKPAPKCTTQCRVVQKWHYDFHWNNLYQQLVGLWASLWLTTEYRFCKLADSKGFDLDFTWKEEIKVLCACTPYMRSWHSVYTFC